MGIPDYVSRQDHGFNCFCFSIGYSPSDATKAFQKAINSPNDTIIIDKQDADWNVGPSTFFSLQNKTILFQSGVVLRALPGRFGATNACLFKLRFSHQVSIIGYGATFKMNKSEYAQLNNSEYRMSISMDGCSDITIKGLILDESGGDGIYIGGDSLNYCKSILLEDVQAINHYRQGKSICNVRDMTVRNCYFAHTKGTLPEAGIDVEPY